VLYLSILITDNAQVRLLTLLIIPVYVYSGFGIIFIFDCIKKVKNRKFASLLLAIPITILSFTIVDSVLYSKKNILDSERTLGFLRISQIMRKQNMQGNILLLMEGIPKSFIKFIGVDCATLIKIENYIEVSEGNLNISNIYYDDFLRILSVNKKQEIYLIKTPFSENDMFDKFIAQNDLRVYKKFTIPITPALSRAVNILKIELKSKYFEILLVKV